MAATSVPTAVATLETGPTKAQPSRVVLERDYTNGLSPRFVADFPPCLADRISQDEFSRVLTTVNGILAGAERVGVTTVLEGCLECVTCFTLPLCGHMNQYERCLLRLTRYLREQNDYFGPYGVEWVNPVENGLNHFDVIVTPASVRSSASFATMGMPSSSVAAATTSTVAETRLPVSISPGVQDTAATPSTKLIV